ncbi:SDR family oxidoreductase [Marinospirillum perlucidum]|uniref:SDR family oxidoreductase n=1 Tax=Marinospirillum perlucidum TaxID=1982602 RepID=UPI000DF31F53|nr:SDR family oxidoreductase [Marinospirillum perlucidum]
MLLVTGASGQLGRLVIEELLKTQPADQIIAAVRSPEKVADLADQGVLIRQADYSQPETLKTAFAGVDRALLISSSEVGQRFTQHQNVINAAKEAGVSLLAYTSILRAPESKLGLAEEHRQTEKTLATSGLDYTLLRNGWYTENYMASLPAALDFGVFLGAAGEGRIASAARRDYAAAAAKVLTSEDQAGKVYELAGDESYTLGELVEELNRQTGKSISYQNLPAADFAAALKEAGLPEPLAELLADSDAGAAENELLDSSHQLSQLIGRPTTPLASMIEETLEQ